MLNISQIESNLDDALARKIRELEETALKAYKEGNQQTGDINNIFAVFKNEKSRIEKEFSETRKNCRNNMLEEARKAIAASIFTSRKPNYPISPRSTKSCIHIYCCLA